jgi:hypothetical protein
MASRREMSHINELCNIIQKAGSINKVHLVMKSRISISLFEKLRPFLLEIHQDKVIYDRDSKLFKALQPIRS